MAASTITASPASTRDNRPVGASGSTPRADEDFALVLARFACELSLGDLTAPVIAAAKANVFDTLACAAAGSSAPAVGETRELAVEWAGAPQATILAFGDKVPAHHAAWVNGTMAHARDYDDTHDAAVLHAGVSVVPAALAAAEWRSGSRGSDFIVAVAAVSKRSAGSASRRGSASSRAASCTRRCSVTLPRPSPQDACSGSTSRRWSTRSASCTRRSPATTR